MNDADIRRPGADPPGLSHHGDAELAPGLVDLAVNVRRARPLDWLREEVEATAGRLAAYPDPAPAVAAARACSGSRAAADAAAGAREADAHRGYLTNRLAQLPGVGAPRAPFVLVRVCAGAAVREALRTRGFAVRRGDTFPGLGPDWLRITVRDPPTVRDFTNSLREVLP